MLAVRSLAASRKSSLPRRDLTRDTSAIPGPRERGYQREVADQAPDETADELCTSRPEPGPAIEGRPGAAAR